METRTSNVSSTPTVEQPVQMDIPLPEMKGDETKPDPWAQLVLSLDGGGVRGLSSLAVLTQRKAHGKNQPNTVYMMRSYNHRYRQAARARAYSALNRGQVDASPLKTEILIDGRWHMDGGVGDNNPSAHAWNEASELSRTNNVAMLVSVGTGMTEPYTKFGGLLSLAHYARKAITETETAHQTTRSFAHYVKAEYFRFDVRPIRDNHCGLSQIKLDECRKKSKKQEPKTTSPRTMAVAELPRDESHGEESTAENRELASERQRILERMDTNNNEEACQSKIKGGYKPHKYNYTTYQTIQERTDDYCTHSHYSFLLHQGQQEAQNVREEINRCAKILFHHSQRRKADDLDRWQRFRRHPDPEHEANQVSPPREA